jgi:hypothetical protein
MPKQNPSKYWYRYTHYMCPICGREDVYKARVYGFPKPDEYCERHEYLYVWDYCDAL